ncbi:MAG: multidrug effflux MFS transporter [Pseudomonadota bacterium]
MAAPRSRDIDNAHGLPDNIGIREFIALIAFLTSIIALSIDSMLPALPIIGEDFALENENDRQLVIIAFVLAFGPSQLIFGPLSDAFGRRPVLLAGLGVFAASSFAAVAANSFEWLLVARVIQGISASAVRICTNAIVRDCFAGREMARVMSFVFTVFILIPIAAPAIGQLIITVSNWHMIFVLFGVFGLVLGIWYIIRLPETLPDRARRPLRLRPLFEASREIMTNRIALGYTLAVTLFFGGLFSFIVSIQQIIETIYGAQDWFVLIFAISAAFIGAASLANAGLVRRHGMRRISHAALLSFTIFGTVLLVWSLIATPPLFVAIALISLIMGSFGFVAGNFNALAMEPLGHIAGAASSILGTISFTGGAILGGITGQFFDGTLVPLASAYTAFGAVALLLVLWTEHGKLFAAGD